VASANPKTAVDVGAGEPFAVVAGWATPAMNGVTVEEVMTLPPLAGAVHDTAASFVPAIAVMPVGGLGAVTAGLGVTALDAGELPEVPTELVARTVNV
jgi:hypothetical protein